MDKLTTFQEFITTQNVPIPGWGFIINLVLSAFLAGILGYVYQRYGHSLSNRRLFSRNFIILAMTTMVIIAIVKSSLALSLGLVGALSIVRFRAAIKEPEELAYLFLVISIGLGLGANQLWITLIAFIVIVGAIVLTSRSARRPEIISSLFITITSRNPQTASLRQVAATINRYCGKAELKRFDEADGLLEASFVIDCADFNRLDQAQLALKGLDPSICITFLDSRGIG
ncbi:hypothetical protein A2994_00180 [candidate division Kazan bacterium RIFCSPLOWO2_01_FULL_48_13]|uniref:DUF4956 domain-containing protein n=1 Tax=candidate division Kazan bacterium RIFCSPLOWO2_01_FULL_48_13 TaxID=1798539 RepID=A0A1F4PME1_UNCK3|nr:MAG: hypothetical protein A2994_00180 [candidate division Kazan bacterium RIFCSPLOWO2_01_FULL_48_13]